ncbi:MAG: putative metal-binding motif-containing protein [Deltaproteobacteria bacterium]|nr:putative metal-binding motif-containing protein [Deltaproteobacteria bacterium]
MAGLLAPGWAFAGAATPSGGCPPPPNTLAFTEYSVGTLDQPRWIEIANPGNYAISLKNVHLVVKVPPPPGGKSSPELVSFDLGQLVDEMPAGEHVAFGWVPAGSALALLKLKVIDLGPEFVAPCSAKLSLEGPAGVIDTLTWDVCASKGGGTWGLDPALTSPCANDDPGNWCAPKPDPNGALKTLGTPGKPNQACDLDGDGVPSVAGAGAEPDCDDKNKAVFPGAVELCNGQDDDCNGMTDDAPAVPLGTCPSTGLCLGAVPVCYGASGFACAMPAGYEPVTESLCDNQDNDCDGLTDEGLTNACGNCGTAPPEECNGKDDDCNGQTDDVLSLPNQCTSTGVCALAKPACDGGVLGCAMPLSYETTETLCDGLDNDCDGLTDEEMGVKDVDRKILASSCILGTGVCARPGERVCALDGTVACKAEVVEGTAEICGDALDNDCDGKTDEDFGNVGSACTSGQGICKVNGKSVCSADKQAVVCSAQPLTPLANEVCGNQLDDDCDGDVDENPCQDATQTTCSAQTQPGPQAWWLALLLALAAVGWRRARAVQLARRTR